MKIEGKDGKNANAVARPLASGAAKAIPAHGFLKQGYGFVLPENMSGTVAISAVEHKTNVAMFHAPARGKKTADPSQTPASTPETAVDGKGTIPKDMNAFQPFFVKFSTYKPVSFLFGMDPGIEKTSFQISFKYKLFNFDGDSFFKTYLFPLEKIHLAYTQQSFWDLDSDSAPFEDSRYMPEIFYQSGDLGLDLPGVFRSGFQAGFQHESNGRDGDDSRSTNYGYIQPVFGFKLAPNLYMKLAPKAWVYVRNSHENNGDIADFRGYFDIETKIGDPKGLTLGNHFRHGEKGATWQFDLSYPLNQIPWLKGFIDLYVHAQYFTGYSDKLLDYNQKEDVFRLGFSLVR
ncbi:MAG: phospholipase A [Desulfobacter sp.]|nr:phospholipase A [Desulfobacter sp.]